MGPVQILVIWGALSGALFPPVSQAGEWEEFKALKDAMVRSTAKRDLPLPVWASSLDYQRADHWYWSSGPAPEKKAPDVPPPVVPAPVPVSK